MSRDGKPMIMWDTGQPQDDKKKKFGYKSKGVKYPLRSKQNGQEEQTPAAVKKPPMKAGIPDPKSAKNASNQKLAKKESSKAATSKEFQIEKEALANDRSPAHLAPSGKDTVTLTQAQFEQILETIGELSVIAESGPDKATGSGAKLSDDLDLDAPLPDVPVAPSPMPYTSAADASQAYTVPAIQTSAAEPTVITNSNPAVPGLGVQQPVISNANPAVPGLDVTSPRYPDPRAVPSGPVDGDVRSSTIGVPWKHLTKAERKRVEWERQRAEAEQLQQQARYTEQLHQQGGSQAQNQPSAAAPAIVSGTMQQTAAPPSQPEPFVLPHVKARLQQEAAKQTQYSTSATTVPPGAANQPVHASQPTNVPGLNNQPSNVPGLTNQPAAVPGLNVQPSHVPGLGNQASNVPSNHTGGSAVPGLPSQPAYAPPAPRPLTKAEIKKLQWEKERAAQAKVTEWDPWGRPGAGAPIRDTAGGVIADYHGRKPEEQGNTAYMQQQDEVTRMSIENPQLRQSQGPPGAPTATQQFPAQNIQYAPAQNVAPAQMQYAAPGPIQNVAQHPLEAPNSNVEPPPAAIRSSFAVGVVAPDENKYVSAKERQRQQWLKDLEAQREEQKRRKEEEKKKDIAYFADDSKPVHQYNYDYKQAAVPSQGRGAPSNTQAPPPFTQAPPPFTQAPPTMTQAPSYTDLPSEIAGQDADTYLRGQNVYMDPKTREEKEMARRKEQEHQDYIKQQMDERQNEKRRERERRWQEEAQEEAKLQAERQQLQNQHDSEQQRTRQKKEAEERKLEVLKQAMENEKERAEWEKHERRMLKLRKGGHDISNYHAKFEAKHTPRDGAASVITTAPTHIPGLTPRPEPSHHAPSHHAPSHRDHAPSVITSFPSPAPLPADDYNDVRSQATGMVYRHDPYTENRVLTPSLYRPGQSAEYDPNLREFGVQADLLPGGYSRESTDIEYHGPVQSKKKVRVKSAAEVKAPKKSALKHSTYTINKGARSAPPNRPYEPEEEYEKPPARGKKPAWGYQNPRGKKMVKQSERDPWNSEKRRRSEAMKARRQKTLENISNQNAPKVAQKTTAAMRARSRSRDRSQSRTILEEEFSEPSSLHVKSQNRVTGEEKRPMNARSRSPGIPALQSFAGEDERESRIDRYSKASNRGLSHRSKSPASKHYSPGRRSTSPPIPALKHRQADYNAENYDNYSRTGQSRMDTNRSQRTKYGDRDPVGAPVTDNDFVPFIRSTNVLDPAHAESPIPMSREASAMQKARMAYIQEHEPATYGAEMENFEDVRVKEDVPQQQARRYPKDPIMNPGLVTEHPSGRQNRILQQLSDLRRGLMQKQRELEVGLPPTEEVAG